MSDSCQLVGERDNASFTYKVTTHVCFVKSWLTDYWGDEINYNSLCTLLTYNQHDSLFIVKLRSIRRDTSDFGKIK